jgi:hypothetical protein
MLKKKGIQFEKQLNKVIPVVGAHQFGRSRNMKAGKEDSYSNLSQLFASVRVYLQKTKASAI